MHRNELSCKVHFILFALESKKQAERVIRSSGIQENEMFLLDPTRMCPFFIFQNKMDDREFILQLVTFTTKLSIAFQKQ